MLREVWRYCGATSGARYDLRTKEEDHVVLDHSLVAHAWSTIGIIQDHEGAL